MIRRVSCASHMTQPAKIFEHLYRGFFFLFADQFDEHDVGACGTEPDVRYCWSASLAKDSAASRFILEINGKLSSLSKNQTHQSHSSIARNKVRIRMQRDLVAEENVWTLTLQASNLLKPKHIHKTLIRPWPLSFVDWILGTGNHAGDVLIDDTLSSGGLSSGSSLPEALNGELPK